MDIQEFIAGKLEEFDKKEYTDLSYVDYGCDGASDECCGNCGGDRLSATEVRKFLESSLTALLAEIEAKVKEPSDIRTAKAADEHEKCFDYGYDVKTKEIIALLRPSEPKGEERPKLGDSNYSSGHSIDVNGNCNMGCC